VRENELAILIDDTIGSRPAACREVDDQDAVVRPDPRRSLAVAVSIQVEGRCRECPRNNVQAIAI
jgi:hypothetical protein